MSTRVKSSVTLRMEIINVLEKIQIIIDNGHKMDR